jgi:hypothetical protein
MKGRNVNGKSNLAIGDFTIAAKTAVRAEQATSVEPDPAVEDQQSSEQHFNEPHADEEPILSKRPAAERERRARERAAGQEEARYSLKNLKRSKQREIKFFVNVALDQATKARLKRAADENDIKMATVMKAAIDFYLSENGY